MAPETLATVRAYTPQGEFLGSIEQADIEELRGPFVGLQTSNTTGIATVVLDYGEDTRGEQINDLIFEFLDKQGFQTYLPQIADGRTDQLSLQTILQIQNPFGQDTQVHVKFHDSSGEPLELELDGETTSELEFVLPSFAVRQFQTPGNSDTTRVGWASIESSLPITATAVYRTEFSEDGRAAEASIVASKGKVSHVGLIQQNHQASLGTALAIANISDSDNYVRFFLMNEGGSFVPGFGFGRSFWLSPKRHRAFFIGELYEYLEREEFEDFLGSLNIVGQYPVSVTTLRTMNGSPISNLPTGSTQR